MTPYVDPATARILAQLAAAPARDVKTLPIAEARAWSDAQTIPWNRGAPDIPTRDFAIPGAGGPMRGRLYSPPGARRPPLLVYVHGGGWTFGSIDTHDGTMRALAVAAGAAVLGFDYRLAPENPFPAPLDDVRAALAYVETGALDGEADASRLTVAGDSAGATLALAAMLGLRDEGRRLPAAAALFYGCYAPDFGTASHRDFGTGYLLTTVNMRWYWGNYLGPPAGAPPPLAVPLDADLGGLPPLYLSAAGLDPLRDDTLNLATRLAAAGAAFRLDHVPGVVHGCLRMSREVAPARRMIEAAAAFLSDRVE